MAWDDKSLVLRNLEIETESMGLKVGSTEFKSMLLEKRVMKCQEMRGISSCGTCKAMEYCSLIKEYLADAKYGNPTAK